MPPLRLHIFGRRGRLGSAVAARLPGGSVAQTDAEDAELWVLAVPTDAAHALLDDAGDRTVLDVSGALKRRGAGRYGLLGDDGRLLDGAPPARGDRLANPGCFASAVIVGLQQAGLAGALRGPLYVSAVGGASTAHKHQRGVLRLARRLADHPHADEVRRATGVPVASFALAVAYAQPAGILATVSGTCDPAAPLHAGAAELDVDAVLGTATVAHRVVRRGTHFTLGVALDNIVFPAANAARLIAALARGSDDPSA